MKVISSLLSAAAVVSALTFASAAKADPPRPSTTTISDYTETSVAGDQVVKFSGDELVGPANGAYGDVIRRPPGVMRAQLIRPRMNFVSELLKSVENL